MFKKVIILLKEGLQLDAKMPEKIKEYINCGELSLISFNNLQKEDLIGIDLVISIGGDGTFVKAAHLMEEGLILGINSNYKTSEGALTSINLDEIDKLKNLDKGKMEITEKQRADVILNGKILDEKVINEIYIGAASQFHSSRYILNFKGAKEEQRSSGVIVSTGTGSDSWFLAAGGKPFHYSEKKLRFIVREPYFGKRVFKPTILAGELSEKEKIVVESTRNFGGIIAINDSTYDFNTGDIVEVKISDSPLKVIKLK